MINRQEWIRVKRKALGWTQARLAEEADVSRKTITQAEAGYTLQPRTERRIRQALDKANLRPGSE